MLQALLHRKLGRAISEGYFSPIEDTLTSSTFGVLQYLPDNILLRIIDGSCGIRTALPKELGRILNIEFWPNFNAEGTYNSSHVEPDVWIECENYHLLIEAKKIDDTYGYAQEEYQWFNEIKGLRNEVDDDKDIILIALGGNENLQDYEINVDGQMYNVYTASWFNLLHAVAEIRKELSDKDESHSIRLLDDCIRALSEHGYFDMVWFETFTGQKLQPESITTLRSTWEFDNLAVLGILSDKRKPFSNINIRKVWKIG